MPVSCANAAGVESNSVVVSRMVRTGAKTAGRERTRGDISTSLMPIRRPCYQQRAGLSPGEAGADVSGESRKPAELFRQQIVEGDPRLVAIGVHLLADVGDGAVELSIAQRQPELLLQEAVANAVALHLVGACDEGRIRPSQGDPEMADDAADRGVVGVGDIFFHVRSPIVRHCPSSTT